MIHSRYVVLTLQPPLPRFDVELNPPELDRWRSGNTGVAGFTSFTASRPGPHLALVALVHGNEFAGAIVLDQLLRQGLRPSRGQLTIGFANLGAFERFETNQPTASRFIDEDLNRLWDPAVLAGPRQSRELDRAREIRPLIDTVDVLLDLHSMLWPSEPLLLSGVTRKGRDLALAVGTPELVVADEGHATGRRLIDYGAFADPVAPRTAVLVEAGQHWERATVATTLAAVAGVLRHLDLVHDDAPLPAVSAPQGRRRFAEVTVPVTATTSSFAFVQPFRGGEIVARQNTLIAMDGDVEVRTPHDQCLLVMPSPRPSRGHTAVRLARFVDVDDDGRTGPD